jgi:hypothetical protein
LAAAALSHARLAHANLKRADLRHADLRSADLRRATLWEAVVESALLDDADLSCANVAHADLRSADLSRANLQGAVLCHARLQGACLVTADLRWSNLANADVSDADFTGANLQGALLVGVRSDAQTRWPAESHPDIGSRAGRIGATAQTGRAVTYRVGKPKRGSIQLWTIQDLLVWERLRQEGTLYVDPGYIRPEYLEAYDWMRDQMVHRLPGYGAHHPWWAWVSQKPDLRRDSHLQGPGDRRVRLELAVSEQEVLLSDHFSWHWVLNRSFIPLTGEEGDAWDAELARNGVDPLDWPLPKPWCRRIMASWERVFDFGVLYGGGMWTPGGPTQATFGPLQLGQVVKVTEFLGR